MSKSKLLNQKFDLEIVDQLKSQPQCLLNLENPIDLNDQIESIKFWSWSFP